MTKSFLTSPTNATTIWKLFCLHPYYSDSAVILDQLDSAEEAVYFEKLDFNYHPNSGVSRFYENKFERISWEWDVTFASDPLQIMNQCKEIIRQGRRPFLGQEAVELLQNIDMVGIHLIPVGTSTIREATAIDED